MTSLAQNPAMSAIVQKQTFTARNYDVCFVPTADILARALLRLVHRSRASYF